MAKDPSPYQYEFVTPDTRLARIQDRLRALEEELVNAQINLAVDTAAVADPDNDAAVRNHQATLDMTLARIEALKELRGSAQKEVKQAAKETPAP